MIEKLEPPASESLANTEYASISKLQLTWKSVAARRREEIYSRIPRQYLLRQGCLGGTNHSNLPQTCGLLTTREISIINLSATEILRRIHNRTFTSVEVTTAFCKSAAIAHQATNCLAWIMFESALADATGLDEYMKSHGKPKGPLHGLPVSVKEHIYLAGTPSTSGFVAWADDVPSADALIVKVFRDAGAVFHVKTTNPQGLMALETESNLYGTTNNPYNTRLTPGGSSGGESALIAMRGSPFGIGTDIGGSIRVPSAFCGIFGLKPSVSRLPHGGLSGAHAGMENIIGAVGPMATSVEDMKLFCKVALGSEPWIYEPPLIELPWKSAETIPSQLQIGVMWHDGVVNPHPPITRCINESVAALTRAGHTIVKWDPTLHRELVECINKAFFLDGGEEYYEIMGQAKEPASPLMKWILETSGTKSYSSSESWKVNRERNRLQEAYAAAWNSAGIDVLLCPANASVASAHGESTYWGYSSAFNLLDYSGAVFPAGSVQEADTWTRYPRSQETMMSEKDETYRIYYGDDGPAKYKDAPVSLQLIARRFREEKLLLMMEKIVDDIARFSKAHDDNSDSRHQELRFRERL